MYDLAGVDGRVVTAGEAGGERHEETQCGDRQQKPGGAAGQREEAALGEELARDPAAAGAERRAQRELPLPVNQAGQREVGDALRTGLPDGFRRAWVIRYPQHDPEAVLAVMDALARPAETERLLDGAVELTLYEREP